MLINNEMDSFLKRLNSLYLKNYHSINKDAFYSMVVHDRTSTKSINHLFQGWIDRFKNNNNTRVFVANDWKYFCQFINGVSHNDDNLIKLYIPLKADRIQEGANIIFDFLSENDIKHLSKIGSHERNDDIVIRVNSISDAKRIIEFVKNNKFIKSSLLPTNPFILNQGGVGLVLDGDLSYNTELSNLIKLYFDERIRQGITSKPNVNEFTNFLMTIMKNVTNKDQEIIYRQIYLKLVKKNYSLDDFIDITNEYQKNADLLMRALVTTKKKYGEQQMVTAVLELLKGNSNYITDTKKMRTKVIKYLSVEQIKRIIHNVVGYNKEREIDNEELIKFLGKVEEYRQNNMNPYSSLIRNAMKQTAIKLGYINNLQAVYDNIKYFVRTKDYQVITSKNCMRSEIERVFRRSSDVMELLRQDEDLEQCDSIDEAVNAIMAKDFYDENAKRR